MLSLVCSGIDAGVGPYPLLVDDENWVQAARMIVKTGSEQFLVNMLYVLRQSLGTGVSGPKDHEDN